MEFYGAVPGHGGYNDGDLPALLGNCESWNFTNYIHFSLIPWVFGKSGGRNRSLRKRASSGSIASHYLFCRTYSVGGRSRKVARRTVQKVYREPL